MVLVFLFQKDMFAKKNCKLKDLINNKKYAGINS